MSRLRSALLLVLPAALAACGGVPPDAPEIAELPASGPGDFRPAAGALSEQPLESAPPRVLLEAMPDAGAGKGGLMAGFSTPRPQEPRDRIWSNAPLSVLRFELEDARPLELVLSCAPFTWPDGPVQTLRVRLNGWASEPMELAEGFHDVRVRLPSRALRSGPNLLGFEYGHVGVPAEVVPGSRDRRTLGVAFRRIALEPEAPVRTVDVRLPGDTETRRSWLHERPGTAALLTALPAGARLAVRAWPLAPADARARIEIETDSARETLWSGRAGAGPARLELDLAAHGGRAVRLRFRLDGPPDARWLWIEPELRATEGGGARDPAPAVSAGAEAQSTGPAATRAVAAGANAIVVVLDAATRRRFGLYGHTTGTTPHIDELAAQSLVFEDAHSQAAYTLASTASLFTARHPAHHGVVRKQHRLAPGWPTLASTLREAGYTTAAFSANGFASPVFGLDHGFDTFQRIGGRGGALVATPDAVTEAFESWLARADPALRDGTRPFFAYLHYIQPHEPYDVAPAQYYAGLDADYGGPIDGSVASMSRIRSREHTPTPGEVERLERLYEGNLRYADTAVGSLLALLEREELIERTVLVVTADHGEALGEGGFFGHNYSLQEEVTAIPLLLRLPQALDRRGRVRAPAASIDLGPTLLGLLGVPVPKTFEGRDLLAGRDAAPPPVVFARSAHDAPRAALWFADLKYWHDPRTGERALRRRSDGADVLLERPVTFAFLEAARVAFETPVGLERRAREATLPADTREALEALGYVIE